ncbi:MAG TPA: polyphenol oxidase family protein [Candidatus Bathyarchaeia archaeon]|nr:polyphenol oxidase family protein [Candidatus Bathyarchaeia archaeon]
MRFLSLERLGVKVAVISEMSDGDCGDLGVCAAFCAGLGIDASDLVTGRQVHGVGVALADEGDRGRCFAATDGLLTAVAGLPLAVFVADCVPVYLVDPVRGVIGLVHSGREGVRQGISSAAVRVMVERLGCRAAHIHALIGPSAGPCCYEVSEPIADQFRGLGLPVDGRRLNLWESTGLALAGAGVPRDQIEVSELCTICGGRFFSYRRDGGGRRNMAVICL